MRQRRGRTRLSLQADALQFLRCQTLAFRLCSFHRSSVRFHQLSLLPSCCQSLDHHSLEPPAAQKNHMISTAKAFGAQQAKLPFHL